jgi:urea transport system permease protein/urea transport system ATP-binding protein
VSNLGLETANDAPSLTTAAMIQRQSRPGVRSALLLAGLAAGLIGAGPLLLDIYTVNILVRSFLYAATALTVDVLWGYTGILTFGQSAFFAIGAYAAGLAFTHIGFDAGTASAALLVGLIAAMAVAALVGWFAFWHGASPLYVSVVTLALSIIATQLLFSGGTFTGSSTGLSGFDSFDISVDAWFRIVGIGLVLLTLVAWVFVGSDGGRILVAMRENEQRCEYLGIRVSRAKILLFVIAAAIAALAGYGYAGYTVVVAPELAGFVFGTELVIWVALGGRGTLVGPVFGAVLIDLTSAYLSGDLPFVWKLFVGLAFVVVIVALPQGLMPLIARLCLPRAWRRQPGMRPAPLLRSRSGGQTAAASNPLAALEVAGLSRHYGSLKVLENIAFTARAGELLSLVGPNGAGKTTLMRCLADGMERSGGTVRVNGHDIGRLPPERCVRFGIGRKFQRANMFDTLTVAECLRVARTRMEIPRFWGRAPTLELPPAALQVLQGTGLDQLLAVEARLLSHGMKQALELAMVLALEPSVLLLDEPTAGLTKGERMTIGRILAELADQHRLCILLVEHDLDFVREVSSRVIVLHQGRILLDGTVDVVVGSELVRTIYSGESHALGVGTGA